MSRARFSEVLANRRHQLGLTIPQAAQVLRLRADVLEAFESGDFSAMPTNGYAQGMLSSYARYLDLNPSEIVDMFNDELEQYRRHHDDSRRTREPEQGYPQGRPYTGRAPYETRSRDHRNTAARRNALRRGERSYAENGGYEYDRYDGGSGNIHTMRVDEGRYEDDLGFTNNAQPYRAASTPEGRTYRNGGVPTGRPNVQRRQPSTTHRRVRTTTRSTRNGRKPQGRLARFFEDPAHAFMAIAIAVVLILTLIIIFSVSSCVSTALGDGEKQVSVSSAQTDSGNSGSSGDSGTSEEEENAREQLAAVDSTSTDTSTDTQTNVTVSVADGAVTWLEVDNDGTSDVADTVTGPWERTYVVTDSITIQAHDTSSVTVTRNGKQMQFDTLSGGVGTLTIKGTKPSSADTNGEEDDSTGTDESSSTNDPTSTSAAPSSQGASSNSTATSGNASKGTNASAGTTARSTQGESNTGKSSTNAAGQASGSSSKTSGAGTQSTRKATS